MARVSADWSYRGFPAVVMENRRIRVVILPGIGARIAEFVDKENDADLLWHHPRRKPEPVVFGSAVADAWWTGGIDDIFPTDFPCTYRNEQLPYLGELWTNAWDSRIDEGIDGVSAELRTRTAISPFEVKKTVVLKGEENCFSMDYEIRNIGFAPYDWYFGIHPGLEVSEGSRLVFPISTAVVDDTWPAGVLASKGTRYTWPACPTASGGTLDLGVAEGPEAGWWTFQYGLDVREGLLGVINPRHSHAYCTTFEKDFFPNLLFYLGYGGWRNTFSIIPQIATCWPGSLSEAVAAGRHRTLAPEQAAHTRVKFHCLTKIRNEADIRSRISNSI
jgi:hypothetical protein